MRATFPANLIFVWSPQEYPMMNTDHETVRYVISSSLLLACPTLGEGTELQSSDTNVTWRAVSVSGMTYRNSDLPLDTSIWLTAVTMCYTN